MANVKVHMHQGGNELGVDDGGKISFGANVEVATVGTNVVISGLPTADPAVAGALWVDAGTLKLSAG